ncbi:MAG: ABC transporter permease subunit [Lentisphaeria bacterium]|nr:ABC transporter permease subunit [Lentisphaeria bacterium]
MPIFTDVSKKSSSAKMLLAGFYAFLIVGGITMIYPFLIMISGAMKGSYNIKNMNVMPKFLYNDAELFKAWTESKYIKPSNYNNANAATLLEFDKLTIEDPLKFDKLVASYKKFKSEDIALKTESSWGHVETTNKNLPENGLGFIHHLGEKYGTLENLNQKLELNFPNWQGVAASVNQGVFYQKKFIGVQSSLMQDFMDYRKTGKEIDYYSPNIAGLFRTTMIFPFTGYELEQINKQTGLQITSINQLGLYRTDGNEWFQQQREVFIRNFLHPRYMKIKPTDEAKEDYQAFIKANFRSNLAAAQAVYPNIKDFDEVPIPTALPTKENEAVLYTAFLSEKAKIDYVDFVDQQTRFRSWLTKTYGSLDKINQAMNTDFKNVADIFAPQNYQDYAYVMANKTKIRFKLATINLRYVFSYIFSHGRAALVTFVFCSLTVITALLVNPLAAYALSRYNLPSTYKVLMILMATMAFPGAVTQIPSFLMLKEFGLLNTYWALILPGLANGYSIFILKGFFDSLPKELYEAASIDGAGEVRMFFQITLNLSKPVLALIALNSFTGAYGNFMFALLICQDESMWTIMVYIFQLQNSANQAVTFASLLLAAVPTFFIFITCQNVIMRGIVVPSEK